MELGNVCFENISITSPIKSNSVYESQLFYDSKTFRVIFSNAEIEEVNDRKYLVLSDEQEIEWVQRFFSFCGDIFFNSQEIWFNTSLLSKEHCHTLLKNMYVVENGTLKIKMDNVDVGGNGSNLGITMDKILFYRSSAMLSFKDIEYVRNECKINVEENEMTSLFQDSIEYEKEEVEPEPVQLEEELKREVDIDLKAKKRKIVQLKEETRNILQTFYKSKTQLLEMQKEMDVLKKHFAR